jgi:membrane protease YdiL (CAAX protease family)
MSYPLPNPDPRFETPEPQIPQPPQNRWRMADLIVFGVFFMLTVLFLPVTVIRIWRIFSPELRITDLTAVDQVILQGIMNLVLVGFIAFLIKVVHRRSFVETIHWFRNYQYNTGSLIMLGATLAITVLIVSSFLPPGETPPIERLLSSTRAVYVFALFGIAAAPLFEEIIFRGFLFKVLFDIGGPGTAVSATAILFALLHLPQLWGSWAGVGLIFVVGFVLSFVRLRSNSLIPSFIIHTSYNAMLFGVFALGTFVQKGVR